LGEIPLNVKYICKTS